MKPRLSRIDGMCVCSGLGFLGVGRNWDAAWSNWHRLFSRWRDDVRATQ